MNSTERRSSRRATVDLRIRTRSGAEESFSRTANLSLGGLYVNELLPFEPGTPVEVDFLLPDDGSLIHAIATVIHSQEAMDLNPEKLPGNGLRFDSLGDESGDALRLYLGLDPVLAD